MTLTLDQDRDMLRHILASLSYRAAKTLRDVPASFSSFRLHPDSRTPVEILSHMGDLFDWALSIARGNESWHDSKAQEWNLEVARFFKALQKFDACVSDGGAVASLFEKLFQGPIADAFTHVGQLAMLRRISGAPIRGENYFVADIEIGRIGLEQSMPRREFD